MSEGTDKIPVASDESAALRARVLALQEELAEWKAHWQTADARITRQGHREVILGERIRELEAENLKLRKIAAHVPSRAYIKAKETAGFAVEIHAKEADAKRPTQMVR